MTMFQAVPSFKSIHEASLALSKIITRTPTYRNDWLSEQVDANIYLKLELLQITGSFKPRGAWVKLNSLTTDEKKRGVVAMSAGNNAQAVAYHAKAMGIPATIIMPISTPANKIERTAAFGVEIILRGNNLKESGDYAKEMVLETKKIIIQPYDDPLIITGQGSLGIELIEDTPPLDFVLIPVGGGGLAAGCAIAIKHLSPHTKIIGVQCRYSVEMTEQLFPHKIPQTLPPSQTLAEGIAVKSYGKLTSHILRQYLDDMIVVEEDEIESGIYSLFNHMRVVAEGAGASSVAALLKEKSRFQGKTVSLVIGGGNIDPRVMSSLLLRGLVHDGKIVHLNIEIQDIPGVLGCLAGIIGNCGGNIIDIQHQRLFNNIMVKMANVEATLETKGPIHAAHIIQSLEQGGFATKVIKMS